MWEFIQQFIKLFKREVEIERPGFIDENDPLTYGAEDVLGEITRDDLTDEDFTNCASIELIDQKDTDFCVGESSNYASQSTEGDGLYSGAFAFATSKIGRDWKSFGTSVLAMLKAKQKYGICKRELYDYKSGERDHYANPANIPQEAYDDALKHKIKAFGKIYPKKGWDQFDLFRAFLNKFHQKGLLIHSGVDAHASTVEFQKTIDGELKLGGPDSYIKSKNYRIGKSIDGIGYFSRWEINQLFSGYIGFDMPKELAELLNKYNKKAIKLKNNSDCYLVSDGRKRQLSTEPMAWANNTLLFAPHNVFEVERDELDLIPTGLPANFTNGKNWQIVKRFFELTPEQFEQYRKEVNEAVNKELNVN